MIEYCGFKVSLTVLVSFKTYKLSLFCVMTQLLYDC